MKKIIIGVAIFCFVVIFGAGAYLLWDFSRPVSVINVLGKASEKVKPDKIGLYFTTSARDASQEKANTENDEKTKKAIEILKGENIEENKIETRKNIYPDYNYPPVYSSIASENVKQPDRIYRAETGFEVEIKINEDTQIINRLSEKLTAVGIENFNQNQSDVSNKEEICKNLEYKAIENALAESEKKIKALGGGQIKKKEISTINNCGNGNNYMMMMRSGAGGATMDSAAPSVLTGENELIVEVNVAVSYKN